MQWDELEKWAAEAARIAETVPEKYKEKCFDILLSRFIMSQSPSGGGGGTPPDDSGHRGEYPNVIGYDGDEVKILRELPGATKKEKQVNAALLVLFAKLRKGAEAVLTSEIRKVCADHGVLDEKNFASHLKTNRTLFMLSGKTSDKTAKLTVPGKKKAMELVQELNVQD